MDVCLEKMDYKSVFKYFSEISDVPRGSSNEKAISDYLVGFAKEHQFEYTQDEANNVIIIKNATLGFENEPAIMLQGHMDIVCEKRKEYTHDFLKDGIKLVVEGDFIHADGTTLGADNGIALAYIMAVFADESLQHPRLEAVITTAEEIGLLGAQALDLSNMQAKYLINLDSEEEGYLLCSCAGGISRSRKLPIKRISAFGKKIKMDVGGLQGGHSGLDIQKNRSNATKILARLLFDLREDNSFDLINMVGGFKDNVIPREATADLLIKAENPKELAEKYNEFQKKITDLCNNYKHELSTSEPEFNFSVEDLGDDTYYAINPVSFEKILFMLINVPNGVLTMSADLEGLVESSLNLGIFSTKEDEAEFVSMIRSSKKNFKYYMDNVLNYMVSFLGGDEELVADYPSWEFQKESKLRNHLMKIYKDMYGKDMIVEAIHAGLEGGVFAEKIPGIDGVSIGPDIEAVHTIEEKVSISSTIRVYQFLEKVLSKKIGE